MKKKIEVSYRCPYCDESYPTRKQAAQCARIVKDVFVAGDLVQLGRVIYRVDFFSSSGEGRLQPIRDSLTLEFMTSPRYRNAKYRKWFCNEEIHVPNREHLAKELKELKKRARAGERLLKLLDEVAKKP